MANKAAMVIRVLMLVAGAQWLWACGESFEPTKLTADRDLEPTLNYYLLHAPNPGKLDELESLRFGHKAGCTTTIVNERVGSQVVNTYTTRTVTIVRTQLDYRLRAEVLLQLGRCLHGLYDTAGTHDIMNPAREGDNDYWQANLDTAAWRMFDALPVN